MSTSKSLDSSSFLELSEITWKKNLKNWISFESEVKLFLMVREIQHSWWGILRNSFSADQMIIFQWMMSLSYLFILK